MTAARKGDLVVGRWGARFGRRAFACSVGRAGIAVKRREGDGVTPVGRHRVEAVLVRAGRMRPMRKACRTHAATIRTISPRDGWSDDPADPAYNGPVLLPRRFSHERMFRGDRLYDLVAVLDWNRGPAVPGRGSAIFLHCWRKPRHPTEGCVAFRRQDLAWILARMGRRSRVVVR